MYDPQHPYLMNTFDVSKSIFFKVFKLEKIQFLYSTFEQTTLDQGLGITGKLFSPLKLKFCSFTNNSNYNTLKLHKTKNLESPEIINFTHGRHGTDRSKNTRGSTFLNEDAKSLTELGKRPWLTCDATHPIEKQISVPHLINHRNNLRRITRWKFSLFTAALFASNRGCAHRESTQVTVNSSTLFSLSYVNWFQNWRIYSPQRLKEHVSTLSVDKTCRHDVQIDRLVDNNCKCELCRL